MRIRNFDLELPREEAFFTKLCQNLVETFPVPDLGAEVTIAQLLYNDKPARSLSIASRGLHALVIQHDKEAGETLEVLLVNSYTEQQQDVDVFKMRRVLGIPNVKLTQLDVISRMVLDFFLDWCDIMEREEIIKTLYSSIHEFNNIQVNCYRESVYPLKLQSVIV